MFQKVFKNILRKLKLVVKSFIKSYQYYCKLFKSKLVFGSYKKSPSKNCVLDPVTGKPYIWLAWTGNNSMPPYLELCIDTIRRHNKDDFEIVVITPKILNKYLKKIHPAYKYLSYVHKSDYLRCELMHNYGGFWLDCDTICLQSLKDVYEKSKKNHLNGYCGKEWGEVIGCSGFGPFRPGSNYTKYWHDQLFQVLDDNLSKLKKHSDSPFKDCLGWTQILGDIVIPLQWRYKNLGITISKNLKIWNPNSNLIFSKSNIDKLMLKNTHVIILNNALYSKEFKSLSKEEIVKNDMLLCRLIQYSLRI